MAKLSTTLAAVLILGANSVPSSATPEFQQGGQASAWVRLDADTADAARVGVRWMPDACLAFPLHDERSLDAELALNAFAVTPLKVSEDREADSDLDLYRLWARYSSTRSEARVGLQKLNFGPARILRALMWFDSVDARDPLGLTDGVYGLLLRHYFPNNANAWLWGLYGNEDLRGVDTFETTPGKAELGGRYQWPVPGGEVAITAHRRQVSLDKGRALWLEPAEDGAEHRLAFDGIWDVRVGLWLEAVGEHTALSDGRSRWRGLLTTGADYTLGSGVHVLGEHFIQTIQSDLPGWDATHHVSAAAADYPIGIMDTVNAIVYYDWDRRDVNVHLGWQRRYDAWRIDLIVFANPESAPDPFGGDGAHVMLTLDY